MNATAWVTKIRNVLTATTIIITYSCVSSSPTQTVDQVDKESDMGVVEGSARLAARSPDQEEACIRYGDLKKSPLWVKKESFVVTRLLKECTTHDGYQGYKAHSPWVAMGFPCTAGHGKIDVGGHYWSPKIVSLILSTDCTMQPGLDQVQAAGAEALKLTPDARLMAFNPFAVQYWEIPGLQDADVGFSIDLRSVEAKQRVWRSFLDKTPIPVRLYGRENAWVRGYDFFFVDGELHNTGPSSFQLKIRKVEPLKKAEINKIRTRCEALQPRRNCSQVFS